MSAKTQDSVNPVWPQAYFLIPDAHLQQLQQVSPLSLLLLRVSRHPRQCLNTQKKIGRGHNLNNSSQKLLSSKLTEAKAYNGLSPMWHYNQLFPECSKWAVISRTLNAIYRWTQVSGTDQLGTRHERDMRNPVSTKDPTSSTMIRKPLEGECKVKSAEVSINVNHSFRWTQSRTVTAGCPRCAPRNTCSGEAMQHGPTNKCCIKWSEPFSFQQDFLNTRMLMEREDELDGRNLYSQCISNLSGLGEHTSGSTALEAMEIRAEAWISRHSSKMTSTQCSELQGQRGSLH